MKRIILIIGILGLMAFGGWYMKDARCGWCPSYTCFGSCFGDGCVCVTAPGEYGGQCYGINQAKEFEARGYTVGK